MVGYISRKLICLVTSPTLDNFGRSNVTLLPFVTNCHPNHHLSVHVRLSNLDSGRPGGAVHPLELELRFPEEVDQDVDADVDRRADQEEQQPHVD